MRRREFFAVVGGVLAAGAGRASAEGRGIRAVLVDRDGTPLAGESVTVLTPGGGVIVCEGATDACGRLDLLPRGHLPDGEYKLRLHDSARLYALAPTTRGQSAPVVNVQNRPAQRPSFSRRFPDFRGNQRRSGRKFLEETRSLPLSPAVARAGAPNREDAVFAEIMAGNVPSWTERWREIDLKGVDPKSSQVIEGKVWVMPDYLSIGTDLVIANGRVKPGNEYVRMAMSAFTAQKIANAFALMLPTEKVTDAVFDKADVKLRGLWIHPTPGRMQNNERCCWLEDIIEGFTAQDCTWHGAGKHVFADYDEGQYTRDRVGRGMAQEATMGLTAPRGRLVAGHKKDIVVWWPVKNGNFDPTYFHRSWLENDALAFTGWNINAASKPPGNWARRARTLACNIPPGVVCPPHLPRCSCAGVDHHAGYCDASHGLRLMWPEIQIDGQLRRVMDVLYDTKLAYAINNEGPVPRGRKIQYNLPPPPGYPS
jgi:hypothetical protein